MTEHRLKTLALTANVLRRCESQLCLYDSINLKELVEFVDLLIEQEKLPRDVKITWLWYDARMGCFSMLIWSEHFNIVPEEEYPPYVETV